MNSLEANKLLDAVDGRTKLAGSNKMELLLFSLGTNETFGINVFKVREVSPTPPITMTPNMPVGVEGVISLRGSIIPVISLAYFIKLEDAPQGIGETMIVTEFSRHTQGFLVQDVDRIIRVDWDKVKPPENMLAGQDGMITAITELDDGRLISILDVERVLVEVLGEKPMPTLADHRAGPRGNGILCRRLGGGAQGNRVGAGQAGHEVHPGQRWLGSLDQAHRHGQPGRRGTHAIEASAATDPGRRGNAGNGRLCADPQHQVG
jgi:chemotaxis signal transduction protein